MDIMQKDSRIYEHWMLARKYQMFLIYGGQIGTYRYYLITIIVRESILLSQVFLGGKRQELPFKEGSGQPEKHQSPEGRAINLLIPYIS